MSVCMLLPTVMWYMSSYELNSSDEIITVNSHYTQLVPANKCHSAIHF